MSKITAISNQARSARPLSQATDKPSARLTVDATPAATPRPSSTKVTEEQIRLRAYLKWEAQGKPQGHDLYFWCEAQRELLAGA